jgi:hypothetical protein
MAIYCYDTEYIPMTRTQPTHPVSFGAVKLGADGFVAASYYAVCAELDVPRLVANPWRRDNVWPYLPQDPTGTRLNSSDSTVKPYTQVASELEDFLFSDGKPELWSWCGAQDHLVLSLFWDGDYDGLPKQLPHLTKDLAQESDRLGLTAADWPQQTAKQHHALADAHYHAKVWRFLRGRAVVMDRV